MKRAFTLIELLCVIVILIVLISIVLPTLARSREISLNVVCLSNLREIGQSSTMYCQDNKDTLWPMWDWNKKNYTIEIPIGNPIQLTGKGHLYNYVDDADRILECPKNKRRVLSKPAALPFDPPDKVDYDYTFVSRTQGLRLGSNIQMGIHNKPFNFPVNNLPPQSMTNPSVDINRIHGVILFIEESTYFNNLSNQDGMYGNTDQISDRHSNNGNVLYDDLYVSSSPLQHGFISDLNEKDDSDCNDLYVRSNGDWIRLESNNRNNKTNWVERPVGWINNPR
jgi:prepilin-type N-terminal cleavage/methylation domain-containing protein